MNLHNNWEILDLFIERGLMNYARKLVLSYFDINNLNKIRYKYGEKIFSEMFDESLKKIYLMMEVNKKE